MASNVLFNGLKIKKWIIFLSPAKGGRIHDIRQLREETLVENIPDEVNLAASVMSRRSPQNFNL
ncbi:MAG: hypothetical protein MH252_05150 [Thermosynechococcaceae cyanobacterium MS004]|nr:hypothetical protein [Thermosynechococcaceae cyanobacterium MS004]